MTAPGGAAPRPGPGDEVGICERLGGNVLTLFLPGLAASCPWAHPRR